MFLFQSKEGQHVQWCATSCGALDEPKRILFEDEPKVSRGRDYGAMVVVRLAMDEGEER